jgi:hypothetical protein
MGDGSGKGDGGGIVVMPDEVAPKPTDGLASWYMCMCCCFEDLIGVRRKVRASMLIGGSVVVVAVVSSGQGAARPAGCRSMLL